MPTDTTPPTVVRTVPADGTTGFDRDANIKARFSEKMAMDTVDARTVLLYRGNYTYEDLNPEICAPESCGAPALTATVSYNADRNVVTLNPSSRLQMRTKYTAVIEGAGDGDPNAAVADTAGNEMAHDHLWHFKTGGR